VDVGVFNNPVCPAPKQYCIEFCDQLVERFGINAAVVGATRCLTVFDEEKIKGRAHL
jgi:hypothetical protein